MPDPYLPPYTGAPIFPGGVPKTVGFRNGSKRHPEPVEGWLLRPCLTLEFILRQAQDDFSLDVNEPFHISTV